MIAGSDYESGLYIENYTLNILILNEFVNMF